MKFGLLIYIAFFTLHCTPGTSASRSLVQVDECSNSGDEECSENSEVSPEEQKTYASRSITDNEEDPPAKGEPDKTIKTIVKEDECSKSDSKRIIVFKDDGTKQCDENPGISPKKQAEELESAGIEVFEYAKARSNRSFVAACGYGTGSSNAFYISPEKKSEALALGFKACP